MRSSGVTLEELKRAIDIISNNNNFNQIVIDKDMLEQLRWLIKSGIEKANILENRINEALGYLNNWYTQVLRYYCDEEEDISETSSYEIVTVDLIKILKGDSNE